MEITSNEIAIQVVNNIGILADALNISGRKQAEYMYQIGLCVDALRKWLESQQKTDK